jgi:hypothetical protein
MNKHVYFIHYGERGRSWAHDGAILLQSDTQESVVDLENRLRKQLPGTGFTVIKADVKGIVCLLNRCGAYVDMCAEVDRIIKEDASKYVRERYAELEAVCQKARSSQSSRLTFKQVQVALKDVEQRLEQVNLPLTRQAVLNLLNDFAGNEISWSDFVDRLNKVVVAITDEQQLIKLNNPGISFDGAPSC